MSLLTMAFSLKFSFTNNLAGNLDKAWAQENGEFKPKN